MVIKVSTINGYMGSWENVKMSSGNFINGLNPTGLRSFAKPGVIVGNG